MEVFGDPQFSETLANFAAQIQEQAISTGADSLDELRALLIQAGQLEQAVSDAVENSLPDFTAQERVANIELENFFRKLTDKTAKSFCAAFKGKWKVAASFLNSVNQELSDRNFSDLSLTIKIPEGYEFYTLFPEQYCVSALRWWAEHPNAKKVLVVGIRSIGTSLSGVVASVLRDANLDVLRFTVRPKGNPFQRTVSFSQKIPTETEHALIVDEGPGISGSSMVAVAEALRATGISRENILFYPGHENPPGIAASEKVRHWWNSTSRYFTPLEKIFWNGNSLRQLLLEKSQEICPSREPFETIADISNGNWRRFAYETEADWPAVHLPFERTKFLCLTRSGEGLLWKFNGLGAANSISQTHSEKFFSARNPALGNFRSFIATRWLNGKRLTRATPTVLNLIGNYLCDAAGSRLSEVEMFSGIRRLAEMAVINLGEVFGRDEIERIETLAQQAKDFFQRHPDDAGWQSYGDGRTAPHEWVRTPSGNIFKTDSSGHHVDHTLVGRQSLWWDFMGAVVEWNFSEDNARSLFPIAEERGMKFDFSTMEFFRIAYAAFRLGQTSLCAEINPHDESEKKRLRAAFEFYRQQIVTRRTGHLSAKSARQSP